MSEAHMPETWNHR